MAKTKGSRSGRGGGAPLGSAKRTKAPGVGALASATTATLRQADKQMNRAQKLAARHQMKRGS